MRVTKIKMSASWGSEKREGFKIVSLTFSTVIFNELPFEIQASANGKCGNIGWITCNAKI